MATTTVKNLYSDRANERRRQFNRLINGCDLVVLNNAPQIDEELYFSDQWLESSPFDSEYSDRVAELRAELDAERISTAELLEIDAIAFDLGVTVDDDMLASDKLDDIDTMIEDIKYETEIYQWFAVNPSDAQFLADHGQYVTYSDVLDVHLLAICHFGTSWGCVDSMVSAFDDMYTDLDKFSDKEEK